MAIRHQPAYVEAFDDPFNFPGLSLARRKFRVERLFAHVEVDADGRVTRGQLRVAHAMSAAAVNPSLFDDWVALAHAADDDDRKFSRDVYERLGANPYLLDAMEAGFGEVCARAELTAHQVRTVELFLEGKGPSEIAQALGLKSRQAAQDRISKALERILSIDRESEDVVAQDVAIH